MRFPLLTEGEVPVEMTKPCFPFLAEGGALARRGSCWGSATSEISQGRNNFLHPDPDRCILARNKGCSYA